MTFRIAVPFLALALVGVRCGSSPASPTSSPAPGEPAADAGQQDAVLVPDADPGRASVDGYVANERGAETWATLWEQKEGTSSDSRVPAASAPHLRQVVPQPNYDVFRRAILLFDKSGVPGKTKVKYARLEVYVNSLNDTLGDQSVVVVGADPAKDTELSKEDFGSVNKTALSKAVPLSDIEPGKYLAFPLNKDGLDAIEKGKVVGLALVFEADRTNSEPPWLEAGKEAYLNIDFAEGTNKPRLVINPK